RVAVLANPTRKARHLATTVRAQVPHAAHTRAEGEDGLRLDGGVEASERERHAARDDGGRRIAYAVFAPQINDGLVRAAHTPRTRRVHWQARRLETYLFGAQTLLAVRRALGGTYGEVVVEGRIGATEVEPRRRGGD